MSNQDAVRGSQTGSVESKRTPVIYRVVGVNYRLIGLTLGLLLLAGIGSFFSRRYFIDRNADQLLGQARSLAEAGETVTAIAKINQFQALKKGNREAGLLGAAMMKKADLTKSAPWQAVSDLLSNALLAQPNDRDLLRESLLVATQTQDWAAVVNQYAPQLEEELQTNPTVLEAALQSYFEQNEPDALVQACLKAIEAKIPSVVPYRGLLQQIASKKTSPSTLSELKRRYPGAARGSESSEEVAPNALPADLARLCRAILDEMLAELPPEQKGAARALRARFQAQEGDLAGARQEVEKGLRESPDSEQLREIAVILAGRDLVQARRSQRSRKDLAALEAKALAAANQWAERPGLAQVEGRYAVAIAHYDAGNPTEALAALRTADKVAQDNPIPEDDGFDSARRMAMLRINIRRLALLWIPGMKQLLPDQRDQLVAWAEEIRTWMTERKLPPSWLELFDAAGDIAEENWPSAAEKLEKLRPALVFEQARGERREVDLRLADCQRRMGKPDAQIAALKRGLDLDPEWVEGQLALIQALASVGRSDEAQALGATAQKTLPEGDLRAVYLELQRLLQRPD
ncbi:MAG: hypothetical protein ACKO3P_21195, partial [Planctomycetaceae bacterium]